MDMHMHPSQRAKKPCHFYIAGYCRFGDRCKFQHDGGSLMRTFVQPNDTSITIDLGPSEDPSQTPAASVAPGAPTGKKPRMKRSGAHCHAWKAGSCAKGAKCFFAHDPEVQAAERRRREAAAREERERQAAEAIRLARIGEEARKRFEQRRLEQERLREAAARRVQAEQEERERQAAEAIRLARIEEEARQLAEQRRLEQEEAARQAEERRLEEECVRQEQEQEKFAATAKEEAAFAIQRVVCGSIVTYSAGLDVRALITGFDSCTVSVRNLPLDALEHEIRDLFTQQGIDPDRLLITSVRRTQDGKQEATIVTDAEYGEVLAVGLDAIEFRDERLTFEVGVCNVAGGMGAGNVRDVDVLTISWFAPSVRYVGACDSMDVVHEKVRQLNGRILNGRKVKVEPNTLPPGRFVTNFNPTSIRLSNLSPEVSLDDLCDFTGLRSLHQLRNNHTYALDIGLQQLRANLERYHLTTFTCSEPVVNNSGIVSVRTQFRSPQDAQDAYDHLEGQGALYYLNSVTPWLRLPAPHTYTLTIPYRQYESQRRMWNELRTSIKDRKACHITLIEQKVRGIARICVAGSVKPAVGALKVRVENLAAGEKVDGWNANLAKAESVFVRSLFTDTGAFLRGDWIRKQLKLYGEPRALDAAREAIQKELERLTGLERTVHLPRQSVGFFIRQGLSELQAILGEESATLDAAKCTITISGGEEARHHLDRLLAQSRAGTPSSTAANEQPCPICMDDVVVPIRLGCGHSYCTACIRHFLLSALESDAFPLVCMGDESSCEVPIALPIIQRLLPPASFNRLLEVVYTAHVSKRPQELVYCKTPDCTQIYRVSQSTTPSMLQCPSCFSTVCSSCNEEGHEGMSCAESRLHKDPEAQDQAAEEWIRSQGNRIKRCPQCNIFIEKNEGCNHMSCRCGAHVCWICLGLFTSQTIYGHMQDAHGGIYVTEPNEPAAPAINPFQGVDFAEQEEALRQAQAARARAARRREGIAEAVADEFRAERAAEERRPFVGQHARVFDMAALRRHMAEQERHTMQEDLRREEERRRQEETRNEGGWCVLM